MTSIKDLNSSIKKKNAVLGIYKDKFKDVLRDEDVLRFVKELEKRNFVTSNFVDEIQRNVDSETFLNLHCFNVLFQKLLYMDTLEVTDSLSSIRNFEYKNLANLINGTWLNAVESVIESSKKKFSIISVSPFDKTSKSIEDLSIPMTIIGLKKNGNQQEIIDGLEDSNFIVNVLKDDYNRILIQGPPQTGKTIHAQSLIMSWVNRAYHMIRIEMILHLSLDKINKKQSLMDAIWEQNFPDEKFLNKEILIHLLNEKASSTRASRNILLFLDSADQLQLVDNEIYELIEGKDFPFPIVVWSREWRAIQLRDNYDAVFQLNGFLDNQLESFLNMHTKENRGADILNYIKTKKIDPSFYAMPLFGILISKIWKEKEEISLENKFDIYDQFIQVTCKKNRFDTTTSEFKSVFKYISKISFDNLNKERIIISDAFQSKDGNLLEKGNDYFNGLLYLITNDPQLPTATCEIKFIHSSVQAYFASNYIVKRLNSFTNQQNFTNYLQTLFDNEKEFLGSYLNVLDFVKCKDEKGYNRILTDVGQLLGSKNLIVKRKGLNALKLNEKKISNRLLTTIIKQSWKSIEKLSFRHVQFDWTCFTSLSMNMLYYNLEYFELEGCIENNENKQRLIDIIKKYQKLKTLKIYNTIFEYDNFQLFTQIIYYLCKFIHNLKGILLTNDYQKTLRLLKFIYKVIDMENMKILNGNILKEVDLYKTYLNDLEFLLKSNNKNIEINKKSIEIMKNIRNNQLCKNNDLDFFLNKNSIQNFLLEQENSVLNDDFYFKLFKLKSCSLDSDGVINLCKSLELLNDLENFRLSNCFCGNIASKILFKTLAIFQNNLIELNIQNTYFTVDSIQELLTVIEKHRHLSLLNISYNWITDNGAIKIFNTLSKFSSGLTTLIMNNCGFGVSASKKLAKSLRLFSSSLRILDISGNRIKDDGAIFVFKSLTQCKSLEELYVENCDFGIVGLESLSKLVNDLSSIKILNKPDKNEGGSYTNIQVTDFSSLIDYITENMNMWIDINYPITLEKIPFLGKACKLLGDQTSITFRDNLSEDQWKAVIIALKNFAHIITSLKISVNIPRRREIGEIFLHLANISLLDVSSIKLEDKGAMNLFRSISKINKNLTEIYAYNCGFGAEGTSSLAMALSHLSKLEILSIFENPIKDSGAITLFEVIGEFNRGLIAVDIHKCQITEKGAIKIAEALQQLKLLKSFICNYNSIKDEGLIAISNSLSTGSGSLEVLGMRNCDFNYDGVIKLANGLNKLNNLKILFLQNNTIGENGMECLKKSLSHITSLRMLYLSDTSLTTNGVEHLSSLMEYISNLTEFSCSNNMIKDEGCISLFKSISKFNHNIINLKLANCLFGPKGALELSEMLQYLENLQTFNVEGNNIKEEGAISIFRALSSSTENLTELILNDCGFSQIGAIELSLALKKLNKINILSLSNNCLTDKGSIEIFQTIQNTNKNLKQFYLKNCNIQSNGIIVLGQTIKKLPLLEILDIQSNFLEEDASCSFLSSISQVNYSLQKFIINNCNLGSKAGFELIKSMEYLPNLLILNVNDNPLKDKVMFNLLEKISKFNLKLTELNINNCNFGKYANQNLNKIIKNLMNINYFNYGSNSKSSTILNNLLEDITNYNTDLHYLNINNDIINNKLIKKLKSSFKNLPNLKYLRMEKIIIDNDKEFSYLFKIISEFNINLQEISLINCNFNEYSLIELSKLMKSLLNITIINLDHNYLPEDMAKLIFSSISSTKIQCISLNNCNISYNGIVDLSNLLKILQNLKILALNNNNRIKDDGAKLIFNTISNFNKKLEELHMENCCFSPDAAILLSNSLKYLSELKLLNISNNFLSDDGASKIFQVIKYSNYKLNTINIDNCHFGYISIVKLAKSLRCLPNLLKLIISNNNIKDDGLKLLIDSFLDSNNKLTLLNIKNCNISKNGIRKLTDILQKMKYLRQLIIGSNRLENDGINNLSYNFKSESGLRNFVLNEISLSSSGARSLVSSLKLFNFLVQLNLSNNYIKDDGILAVFNKISLKHLEVLELENCYFGKLGAIELSKYLNNLKNLKILNINQNQIRDDGIISIINCLAASNRNLRELHIEKCNFGCKGSIEISKAMENFQDLINFSVSFNRLEDRGAFSIFRTLTKFNNKLVILKARDCHFGIVGVSELSIGLENMIFLEEIDCQSNILRDKGAKKLFSSITINNRRLKKLNFNYCYFTESALKDLIIRLKFLNRLELLSINGNAIDDKTAIDFFHELSIRSTNLRQLFIANCGFTSNGALALAEAIKSLRKLETVRFESNPIKDIGISRLLATIIEYKLQLRDMVLYNIDSECLVVQDIVKALMIIPDLKELFIKDKLLNHNQLIFEVIALVNHHIESLYLENINIQPKDIQYLVQALSHLKEIKLIVLNNNKITNEGIKIISQTITESNQELEEIRLNNCLLNSHGISDLNEAMIKLRTLKILSLKDNRLSDEGMENLFKSLSIWNTNLEELNIEKCNFGHKGANSLGKILKNLIKLKILNINNNFIENDGAIGIFDSISSNNCNKLEQLSIMNCGIEVAGAKSLAVALKKLPNLKILSISYNFIGTEGSSLIFQVFSNYNKNLEELYASSCKIGPNGGQRLSENIKNLMHLKVLSLDDNPLDEDSCCSIFSSISNRSKNLRSIYLNNCAVGISAACELSKAMNRMPDLTELRLNDNPFMDEGAISIFSSLSKFNPLLKDLIINGCQIDVKGAQELANTLNNVPYLEILDISSNSIKDPGASAIFISISQTNTKVNTIAVRECDFTTEAALQLAQTVKNLPNLKRLAINNNLIGNKGVSPIFSSLTEIKNKLTELYIDDCHFNFDGIEKLKEMLKNVNQLKIINLSNNFIGDNGAQMLFKVLSRFNRKLSEVYASNCNFKSNGAIAMAEMVKYFPDLRKISFSSNDIKDDGASFLFRTLINFNKKLYKLEAENCNFGYVTAMELMENLEKLPSLRILSLQNNAIKDEKINVINKNFANFRKTLEQFNI